MLHELRFGINNWGDNYINPRSNSDFDVDSLGIGKFRVAGDGNRKFTPKETGIPGIGFTIGDLNGRTDDTYSYQIADNLSVVRGKHTFKTGVLIVHAAMDRRAANLTRGALSFGPNESGLDFASFLLGYPTQSQTAEGYPSVNMRSRRVGAYIADEWKVSSNLSVSAGLRFDYMGNPYDLLGHVRTVESGAAVHHALRGPRFRRYSRMSKARKLKKNSGSRWRRSGNPASASPTGRARSGLFASARASTRVHSISFRSARQI